MLETLAMQMALRGMVLRSVPGGPLELGCDAVQGRKVIRCNTEQASAAAEAARYGSSSGRDALLMLGDWFDDPVSLVLNVGEPCPIAVALGVPVYDVGQAAHVTALREWLR